MKAGGLAVAMSDRAWRAERAESAAGLRGNPIVMLNRDQAERKGGKNKKKYALEIYRVKRLDTAYNVSSRSMGSLKQLEYNGLPTMSSDYKSGCPRIKHKIE